MIHLVTFEDFSVNHFVDNSEPRGKNVSVLLLLQVVQVDHRQVRRNVGPQFHATPTLGPAIENTVSYTSGFSFHRVLDNTNKWIWRILEFRKKS